MYFEWIFYLYMILTSWMPRNSQNTLWEQRGNITVFINLTHMYWAVTIDQPLFCKQEIQRNDLTWPFPSYIVLSTLSLRALGPMTIPTGGQFLSQTVFCKPKISIPNDTREYLLYKKINNNNNKNNNKNPGTFSGMQLNVRQ